MNTIETLLKAIKANLKNASYLVAQEEKGKDIYDLLLDTLADISYLEKEFNNLKNSSNSHISENIKNINENIKSIDSHKNREEKEIEKVKARLIKWADKWSKSDLKQNNAMILVSFLLLKREKTEIKLDDLKENFKKIFKQYNTQTSKQSLSLDKVFYINFSQMKNIADKNHGKIFNENNSIISIWEKVEKDVDNFEKKVNVYLNI